MRKKYEAIEKVLRQLEPFLAQPPICLDVNRLLDNAKKNLQEETEITYEEFVGGKKITNKPVEINMDTVGTALKLGKEIKSLLFGGK